MPTDRTLASDMPGNMPVNRRPAEIGAAPAGIAPWHLTCDGGRHEPRARALEERFDEVCRAEIVRLTRKPGRLGPDERGAVQELTLEVVHAIAVRAGAALGRPDGEHLAPVVARLFEIKEGP